MESFYGGRAGSSFVIVARFDAVHLLEPGYRYEYFAVNENEVPYVTKTISPTGSEVFSFIERNGENVKQYSYQKAFPLNGDTIEAIDIDDQSTEDVTVPLQPLKGMVEEFKKGNETVDIVNYGEYVIIDTFDKNNPDNGKVYRRGMNIDDDLGGAEYIGQIAGPQGGVSDIDLLSQDLVPEGAKIGYQEKSENDHSLVPGYDGTNYNDKIYYKQTDDDKDDYGIIKKFQVGLQIPYLVHGFTGNMRSPYEDGSSLPSDFNLIDRNDDGSHPFYQKFTINVPQGYKGDTPSNFKVFPTIASAGIEYQDNKTFSGNPNTTDRTTYVKIETQYEDQSVNCVSLVNNVDGTGTPIGYAKLYNATPSSKLFEEHLIEYHLGYLLTNYEHYQVGESKQMDAGPYKDLDSIDISADGVITINYTSGNSTVLDTKIKYPTSLVVNGDGSITTNYNRDASTTTEKTIKQINNIKIENTDSTSGLGDDCIKIIYNDGTEQWLRKKEGENYPVNFVDKTAVDSSNGQLLVRYTNPGQRGTYEYDSDGDGNKENDQTAIGLVKGDPGGVQIVKYVTQYSDLFDADDNAIPPENLTNPPDNKHIGWCAALRTNPNPTADTKAIYQYDYNTKNQYTLTSMIASTTDPTTIIGTDYGSLAIKGVQLVVSQRKSV